MRKKIVVYCVLMITTLMMVPMVSSYSLVADQQAFFDRENEKQQSEMQEPSGPTEITGYLLIHVSVYTPGEGLRPYEGANISVRGLFYSYNGQTDEKGDCLFQVHTHLFRAKRYFVKVGIPPENWLHTKIFSIFVEPWEVIYRNVLFIVL
jgi:hypothetical protein